MLYITSDYGCFMPRIRIPNISEKVVIFTPRSLSSEQSAPCTYQAGSRAGLDYVEKRKISCSCRESNPDSKVIQPVA
jgi:hypothetical protein